jgi:hypothetical protein
MRKIDMTGQKIGKWQVLRKDNSGDKKGTYWICQCECGEIVSVFIGNLRANRTTSCHKCAAVKDVLTGKKYNHLLVLKETEQRSKSRGVKWLCRCDCGNETIVSGNALKLGGTKTCGRCPTNTFIEHEQYVIGTTSNGTEYIFDKQDYDFVKKYNWYEAKGYVIAIINHEKVCLHRILLNAHGDMEVDHVNGIKTDNRRSNLRECNHENNSRNVRKQKNKTSSKYKGVSYDKARNKWEAYIITGNKKIHLGRYVSEETAAEAYNKKAKELFGEYAKPNKL